MKLRIFFIVCMFLATVTHLAAQDSLKLLSPNGSLEFRLISGEDGLMHYSINYRDKEVVLPSVLGVEGWSNQLSVKSVSSFKQNTSWKPVYGERSVVQDIYNEKIFTLERSKNDNQPLLVQVRAYDAGIAFRYSFPENPAGGMDINISKELTEFALPNETNAWFTDHAQGVYKLLTLNNWPGEAERPLTLQ